MSNFKLTDDGDAEAAGLIEGQKLADLLNRQMRQPANAIDHQAGVDRSEGVNRQRRNNWKSEGGKQV